MNKKEQIKIVLTKNKNDMCTHMNKETQKFYEKQID